MCKHYTSSILHLPFIIATVMMTASCTLSMEEYVVPEEEKGFDEVVTETYDCGEVSYQFNEDVVRLTEQLQEDYLVRIEDDSVLYLSENMPKKYQPYVGGKIWAGFSHAIPFGLNSKVLSVENIGGILKVVTTKTTREDVFKHLSYNFDYEGTVPDLSEMDDEELADWGYERRDTMLIDWNPFDEATGRKKVKTRDSRDTTIVKEKSIFSFCFDSSKLSEAKAFFDLGNFNNWLDIYNKAMFPTWWQEWNPYIRAKGSLTHCYSAHTERNEAHNYECSYTDTWDEFELGIEAGISRDFASKSDPEAYGKIDEFWQNLFVKQTDTGKKASRKEATEMLYSLNLSRGKQVGKFANVRKGGDGITVVLSPWFSLWLTWDLTPQFEIAGCFSAKFKYTTEKKRTGYTTINGVQEEINPKEPIASSSISIDNISINGSLTVGARARVGVGFIVAGTMGVTIGANLETKASLEGALIFKDEENDWGCTPTGKVTLSTDFWCDLKFHFCPLGINVWDTDLVKFPDPPVHIFYYSHKFEPEVKYVLARANLNAGALSTTARLSYRDLDGMDPVFHSLGKTYYPAMRLYRGTMANNDYIYMEPTDENGNKMTYDDIGRVKADKEYYFSLDAIVDEDETEIHLVPTLLGYGRPFDGGWDQIADYILGTESEIVCNFSYPIEVGEPRINTIVSYQTYGGPNYDFRDTYGALDYNSSGDGGGMSVDPSTLSQFKFMSSVNVYNGSRIQEWGVKVYLYDSNKKRFFRKKIPINTSRSGTYTLLFNFITNWKPSRTMSDGSEETLFYRVIPYWKDLNGGADNKGNDNASLRYNPIQYEQKNITPKVSSSWGEIMPEIDLE